MQVSEYQKQSLKKFTFDKSTSHKTISRTVNKFGFAIIPNFLSDDETKLLHDEIIAVQSGSIEGIREEIGQYRTHHYSFSSGVMKRQANCSEGVHCFDEDSFIVKLRENSLLKYVTQQFFPKNIEYLYPTRYLFMKTFAYPPAREERGKPLLPYDLHFDRQELLKFFFYTTDVTLENGPLVAVPDEEIIKQNRLLQQKHRAKKGRWQDVNQFLEIDAALELPVIAPKGSLVILDSNVPHRQSKVINNALRQCMVIEAQTVEEAYYSQNIKIPA